MKLNLILLSIALAIPAYADGFSRKKVQLKVDTVLGGVAVKAGDAEVFEPSGDFAEGVLAADSVIQRLTLPAASKVNMESPGKIAEVNLPDAVEWVAGTPFRQQADLTFGYSQYYATLRGLVAYKPSQYPHFPKAGLKEEAFENDVTAECNLLKDYPNEKPHEWYCRYEMTLANPLEQTFGSQRVTLPELTRVHFEVWGIQTLQLSRDQEFMGLPVSAAYPIRVGQWVANGPFYIDGLHLSQDANYRGIILSAIQEVEFFEPDASGQPVLESFAPAGDLQIHAGGTNFTMHPLRSVVLNRDGSLHYGEIASAQTYKGILFPEGARLFFGDHDGTPIESVGLQPHSSVVIDGVTYGPGANDTMLFIDFDDNGRVVRVRS